MEKKGNKHYIQNDDGSPHDKKKGEKGKLPKWLNDKLIEKAGWDYNGKHQSFFDKTETGVDAAGVIIFTYADGTVVYQKYAPYLPSQLTAYETAYYQNDTASNDASNNMQIPYLPIIGPITVPSFTFGFSWGWFPIPLLF